MVAHVRSVPDPLPTLGTLASLANAEEQKARSALEARIHEMTRLRSNAVVWGMFWLLHYPEAFGARWDSWRTSEQRAAEEFMFDLAAYIDQDRQSHLRTAAERGIGGLKVPSALYEFVVTVVNESDDIAHEDGQVKGQYMQASNSKIGFFVVVLQRHRKWNNPAGGRVDFPGLIGLLEAKALALQAVDPALFLRIVGIDAAPQADFRASMAATKAAIHRSAKYADEHGNTWGGKGRRPQWLKDALGAGKTLADFEIGRAVA